MDGMRDNSACVEMEQARADAICIGPERVRRERAAAGNRRGSLPVVS